MAKLDQRRREHGTSVLFVTHSVNPVMGVVDRLLYLAPHGHTLGTVDEVMRTEVLSRLYGTHVEVHRLGDRLVVL